MAILTGGTRHKGYEAAREYAELFGIDAAKRLLESHLRDQEADEAEPPERLELYWDGWGMFTSA